MGQIDLRILQAVNGLAGQNALFDTVAAKFTDFAPLIFFLLFAWYFFRPGATVRMRRTVLLAGLSGVVALALVFVITLFVYRERPFMVLPADQLHMVIQHAADSSFPSDHATGSAAFAVGMWFAPDRGARWIFGLVAVLVGLSRLVVGVHWPSDVLGSFLLGGLTAGLIFRLARPLAPELDRLLASAERRLRRR